MIPEAKPQGPPTILRYGAPWPADFEPIEIEMECIRNGGKWKLPNGNWAGMGLFHHFKALDKILWPKAKWHRWHELLLRSFVDHRLVGIMGPADSGKSNAMARWALLNYFVWPDEITILASSTDLRGLELRIWGEIKKYWRSAKKLFPQCPGNILEARIMISTESIGDEEARDFRNGIIGIPCIVNNNFVGIAKYIGIKNKRTMLLGDECFPAGTLVDTPRGSVTIDSIRPGDVIVNPMGGCRVRGIRKSIASSLVRIRLRGGRQIVCTQNHSLLTQLGWVNAVDINCKHYMLGTYEGMSILQDSISTEGEKFGQVRCMSKSTKDMRPMFGEFCSQISESTRALLLSELLLKMETGATRSARKILLPGTSEEIIGFQEEVVEWSKRPQAKHGEANADRQPNSHAGGKRKNSGTPGNEKSKAEIVFVSHSKGSGSRLEGALQPQHGAYQSRSGATGYVPGWTMELCGYNRKIEQIRISSLLPRGYRFPRYQIGNRSRRSITSKHTRGNTRCEEESVPRGAWVESCEVLQQEDLARYRDGEGRINVYNLHVEKHHTYSVNGFLVSNCQFMQQSFLDAIANLNKPNFRCVVAGNPKDPTDSLGKFCEPSVSEGGWEGVDQAEKTKTWRTKFPDGICVNLVGTDSPNMDVAEDQPIPFPFLISRQQIKDVIEFYGKDSLQYWMQCVGMMRQGAVARRVITKMLCRKFRAMEPPDWQGDKTKVLGLDAAYGNVGGDRCALVELHFGNDPNGLQLISVADRPVIVPVTVKFLKLQEDQISEYVMNYAKERGIPPEHVFYDATGRGTLAMSFARTWSNAVTGIEFGGKASERPISKDKLQTKCRDLYGNFVTELWFSSRVAIESGQMRNMPDEIVEEGILREWELVQGNKIQVEPKQDTKLKLGRSPDLYDAFVTALEGARRLGFQINALGGEAKRLQAQQWLQQMRERFRSVNRSKTLKAA